MDEISRNGDEIILNAEEIRGHLGVLFDEHAEDEEVEASMNFLHKVYEVALDN